MRLEESVEVDAPPDRVWKLIEDPAALTGLDDGLSIEADPETPNGGLHARYRILLMGIGPVPIGADVEIVELVAGQELAWTSLTGVDHRFRLRLRETDGGARLVLRFGYSSPGPFGLLADLASYGRIRATMRRLLAAVKAEAERAPLSTASAPRRPRVSRRGS